jgi:plasmid stability protein
MRYQLASKEAAVVDILVRNVDAATARRLKEKAAAKGKSLSETVRDALAAYVKPDKAEAWARIDAIRKKIGEVSGDSTADIREDRDSR